MSLVRALHERWAAYRPLADVVPPQRVVTGLARSELQLPYVLVSRLPDRTTTRTSSGHRLKVAVVRWLICDESLDAAQRVAEALDRLLHGSEFTYAAGRVLDAHLAVRDEQPTAEGLWRLSLDYLMTLDES